MTTVPSSPAVAKRPDVGAASKAAMGSPPCREAYVAVIDAETEAPAKPGSCATKAAAAEERELAASAEVATASRAADAGV
jgi:hypothetical protein